MKPGRPTKRSPEREQAILESLRLGNTRAAAAGSAGVSHDSLWRWMTADAEFCEAVIKAEAEAEARFLSQVARAATDGTWTAAAWWLERRRPDEYGRRERSESKVELTGKDGGPVELVESLSDHEKRLLRQAIRDQLNRSAGEKS